MPYVCLVIEHWWPLNVVRTKKKEKKAPGAVCHLCSQHILMSSVIYCYQGGRHHGICLFCIVKKQHVVKGDVRYASVLQLIIGENQSKGFCSSVYHQIWCTFDSIVFARKRRKTRLGPFFGTTNVSQLMKKKWKFFWRRWPKELIEVALGAMLDF